jgi:hypothetical protein
MGDYQSWFLMPGRNISLMAEHLEADGEDLRIRSDTHRDARRRDLGIQGEQIRRCAARRATRHLNMRQGNRDGVAAKRQKMSTAGAASGRHSPSATIE